MHFKPRPRSPPLCFFRHSLHDQFPIMSPRCSNAPSAAKLFVQLANGSRNSLLPEVFLPRQTRAFRTPSTTTPPKRIEPAYLYSALQVSQYRSTSRREFSVTSQRRKTQAIHNSQVDENGEAMMLEITPRAAQVRDLTMSCCSLDY